MPAVHVVKTLRYEDSANNLTGSTYTLGENLYISKLNLKITNKSGDAVTPLGTAGVVAVLDEPPSLSTSGSRMVLRFVNVDSTVEASLKILLQATEL
jgi:hypothetical protein